MFTLRMFVTLSGNYRSLGRNSAAIQLLVRLLASSNGQISNGQISNAQSSNSASDVSSRAIVDSKQQQQQQQRKDSHQVYYRHTANVYVVVNVP
jgi:hypothetical protein